MMPAGLQYVIAGQSGIGYIAGNKGLVLRGLQETFVLPRLIHSPVTSVLSHVPVSGQILIEADAIGMCHFRQSLEVTVKQVAGDGCR